MLVLGRKESQSVICRIGGLEVRVTVLRVGPNSVRIGITAPLEMEIHREEAWERIREKEKAR